MDPRLAQQVPDAEPRNDPSCAQPLDTQQPPTDNASPDHPHDPLPNQTPDQQETPQDQPDQQVKPLTEQSPQDPANTADEPVQEDVVLLTPKQRRYRKEKLIKLTGRPGSLTRIEAFISPRTASEAVKDGNLVVKSDKIKDISGTRPMHYQIDNNVENQKKIAVLNKRFGRDNELSSVLPFINTADEDEALAHAKKLHSMEKMRKKFGDEYDADD